MYVYELRKCEGKKIQNVAVGFEIVISYLALNGEGEGSLIKLLDMY